jgi:hypothetical protein
MATGSHPTDEAELVMRWSSAGVAPGPTAEAEIHPSGGGRGLGLPGKPALPDPCRDGDTSARMVVRRMKFRDF